MTRIVYHRGDCGISYGFQVHDLDGPEDVSPYPDIRMRWVDPRTGDVVYEATCVKDADDDSVVYCNIPCDNTPSVGGGAYYGELELRGYDYRESTRLFLVEVVEE